MPRSFPTPHSPDHPRIRGTNFPEPRKLSQPSDYPRARGNNHHTLIYGTETTGSPTPTWGQHPPEDARFGLVRITHAHVGTTNHPAGRRRILADHPRARGNNVNAWCCDATEDGSPTRTWEQRSATDFIGAPFRITHAYVGTTPFSKPMIPIRKPVPPKPYQHHATAKRRSGAPRGGTSTDRGSNPATGR